MFIMLYFICVINFQFERIVIWCVYKLNNSFNLNQVKGTKIQPDKLNVRICIVVNTEFLKFALTHGECTL